MPAQPSSSAVRSLRLTSPPQSPPVQSPARTSREPAVRPRPPRDRSPRLLRPDPGSGWLTPRRSPRGGRAGTADRGAPKYSMGGPKSKVVMLPDGQLGWPNRMVFTDEPFRPLTAEEMKEQFLSGPYKGFQVLPDAALPDLLPVLPGIREGQREAAGEPLCGPVQVVPREGDRRPRGRVPPGRRDLPHRGRFPRPPADRPGHPGLLRDPLEPDLFFYENPRQRPRGPRGLGHAEAPERGPRGDASDPDEHRGPGEDGQLAVMAGRGPRRRLAAPTSTTRHGAWAEFSKVNPFHMATLHDLEDTQAIQGRSNRISRAQIGRSGGPSMVESIVTRDRLSPTDYSLAWALTHYLANKRKDAFVSFLKDMSKMPPLVDQTPEDHLRLQEGLRRRVRLARQAGHPARFEPELRADPLLRRDLRAAPPQRLDSPRRPGQPVSPGHPRVARRHARPAERAPTSGRPSRSRGGTRLLAIEQWINSGDRESNAARRGRQPLFWTHSAAMSRGCPTRFWHARSSWEGEAPAEPPSRKRLGGSLVLPGARGPIRIGRKPHGSAPCRSSVLPQGNGVRRTKRRPAGRSRGRGGQADERGPRSAKG